MGNGGRAPFGGLTPARATAAVASSTSHRVGIHRPVERFQEINNMTIGKLTGEGNSSPCVLYVYTVVVNCRQIYVYNIVVVCRQIYV